MIYEWHGVLYYLAGFENNDRFGSGSCLNFILSNGARSAQRDEYYMYFTHMLPEGSHKKIRSVNIYYGSFILGLEFFDQNKAKLCEIGYVDSNDSVKTVVVAENEVIVGVVAKLFSGTQSCYTDFQFQIAVDRT